jgi:hypothetical protein
MGSQSERDVQRESRRLTLACNTPGSARNTWRTLPTIRARKRQNVTLRIPESVLIRVHARMAVK